MPAYRDGPPARALAPVRKANRREAQRPKPKPVGVFARPPQRDFTARGKPRAIKVAQKQTRKVTERAVKQQGRDQRIPVTPTFSAKYLADHQAQRQAVQRAYEGVKGKPGSKEAAKGEQRVNQGQRLDLRTLSPSELEPLRRAQRGENLARQAKSIPKAADYQKPDRQNSLVKAGLDVAFAKTFGLLAKPALKQFGKSLNATTGGASAPVTAKIAKNAARELIDLPANTVTSTYMTGAAAVEAAKGHPERAQKLIKGLREGDPIALAAQGRFREAGNAAVENPVSTALEVSGGKALVGRNAGRVMRHQPFSAKVRQAASTERAPLRLYGNVTGGPTVNRKYSSDVLTKAAQVAREKVGAKHGQPADLARSGTLVPKRMGQQVRLIHRRVDEEVAATEGVRRSNRGQTVKATEAILAPPTRRKAVKVKLTNTQAPERTHAAAVPLGVLRIARKPDTAVRDLEGYRDRVKAALAAGGQTKAEERHQRQIVDQIDTLLKDGSFLKDPGPAMRAASEFSKQQNERTRQLVEKGLLHPDEENAKYVPYAVQHMGAKPSKEHFLERDPTPAQRLEATNLEKRLTQLKQGETRRRKSLSTVQDAERRIQVEQQHVKEGQALRRNLKSQGKSTKPIDSRLNDAVGRLERRKAELDVAKEAYTVGAPTGERLAARLKEIRQTDARLAELRGPHPITPDDVKAHLKAHGVEEPGFFSQRPNNQRSSDFYVPAVQQGLKRPTLFKKRRTGQATAAGTFDINPEVLVRQAVRDQGSLDAAKGFDRIVNEFGIHKPLVKNGEVVGKREWRSWDAATRAGEELAGQNNGLKLVPVHVGSLKRIHDLLDAGVPDETAVNNVSDSIRAAFERQGGNGRYVLVPEVVKRRLLEHVQPRGDLERAAQAGSNVFKKTVLTTSAKWLFGNAADVTMRSGLHGLTPADVVRGVQTLRALEKTDPEQAQLLRERTLGGAFFGHVDRIATYREPGKFASAPVIRHVRGAWNTYTGAVFRLNTLIEKTPQYAALGQAAKRGVKRDLGSLGGAFKIGEKALDDFAKGLTETPAQVEVAHRIQQIFGRWGVTTPAGRRFLVQYAPFGRWLGVALKLVYVTLPHKHPVKTALFAAMGNATEEERKRLHLSLFADKPAPSFLQGSIPTKGGLLRTQGYTSFGVVSGFPDSFANTLLPQVGSATDALKGLDWKGQKLVKSDGQEPSAEERALIATYVLAEGFVPFLSHIRRYGEQGGKSAADSTAFTPRVKPGTKVSHADALNRIFNPLRPTSGEPPKAKSGGSGGSAGFNPWGGGGGKASSGGFNPWGK